MEKLILIEDLILSKKKLKENDVFVLSGMRHKLLGTYLKNLDCSNKTMIFKVLGIKNPIKFCKKSYGYGPRRRGFPETKILDYTALTRLSIALFEREKQRKSFFSLYIL